MPINNDNFVIIGSEKQIKANQQSPFYVQERENINGKAGKVTKLIDGKGDALDVAKSYIKDGFDPSKIIINGEPVTDVLDMKKTSRAKYQIGNLGIKAFGRFTDEEAQKMNKEKTLLKDYYLVFSPESKYYINKNNNGTVSGQVNIIKLDDKKKANLDKSGIKYTNKIGDDYEIEKRKGVTYLKEKNVDLDKACKKSNRFWWLLGGGTVVSAIAGDILLNKGKYCKQVLPGLFDNPWWLI